MRKKNSVQGPILLLGSRGMLGRAWRQQLDQMKLSYHAPSHRELDLADRSSLQGAIQNSTREPYRYIINCAAYTNVDNAEIDEKNATLLNGDAVACLAKNCSTIGATLIHYSTDYVFNGQATAPYLVDQPRQPINAYGRSKAAGELAIEQSKCQFMIIRTSWLYAPWGNNFVRTMAKLIRQRDQIKVVNDQLGRPTSCEQLVQTTIQLMASQAPQAASIYHASDDGQCTWYEFAKEIAAQINPACKVLPCTTADFPRPAKRPTYSVMDIEKTKAIVTNLPHWKIALSDVLTRLEKDNASF